jgi:hypothetical protein
MTSNDEEREALALVTAIEDGLIAVLERYTRAQDAAGAPRFGRHLALHATADLLGRLMVSAIDAESEPARRSCQQMVDALHMLIAAPMTTRPQ